jgi:hypothetical protein
MTPRTVIHVDFETGGFSTESNPILSATFLVARGEDIHEEHNMRCKKPPQLYCNPQALAVNKLDPSEGDPEPVFFAKVKAIFEDFQSNYNCLPLVSAFNAPFEFRFFRALALRQTYSEHWLDLRMLLPLHCTKQAASEYFKKIGKPKEEIHEPGDPKPRFTLSAVYYAMFGEAIDRRAIHSANVDTLMSMRIFAHLEHQ